MDPLGADARPTANREEIFRPGLNSRDACNKLIHFNLCLDLEGQDFDPIKINDKLSWDGISEFARLQMDIQITSKEDVQQFVLERCINGHSPTN